MSFPEKIWLVKHELLCQDVYSFRDKSYNWAITKLVISTQGTSVLPADDEEASSGRWSAWLLESYFSYPDDSSAQGICGTWSWHYHTCSGPDGTEHSQAVPCTHCTTHFLHGSSCTTVQSYGRPFSSPRQCDSYLELLRILLIYLRIHIFYKCEYTKLSRLTGVWRAFNLPTIVEENLPPGMTV